MRVPRPLDPVRSIKAKLAVLVVASTAGTSLTTWYFLVFLQVRARYGMILALVAGVVLVQFLGHGMTSPLRQMTRAAREMAAGRPPGRIRTTSRDEVGDLARAFVAMSDDLASADAQRRELLANVAHELRTPVAAVRAQLENLVDGVRPADGPALEEMLTEVERLGGLVDDLLGLARADAGVTPLRPGVVDVPALLGDAAAQVRSVRPGISVRLDVTPGLVVRADEARLRQVVVNLLDNATRHARAAVHVLACRADGALLLEVADDGPGIPPGERDAVFERFRRGAGSTGTTGGTGLGLAIARWAVALHGGRIEVLPAARGARIRVTLPDGPPVPPADG